MLLLFIDSMMVKLTQDQFNVGAERFIRDWRTTEVILSVRDLRMHEHEPLVGIVVLPLAEIFKQRSQFNDYFSSSGGIGNYTFIQGISFRLIYGCRAWSRSHLDGVSVDTITST
jgi:hypothetical protein